MMYVISPIKVVSVEFKKMAKFKVGEEVFWKDPDDTSSGFYIIQKITGDIYLIKNEFSEAEVPENEISYDIKLSGRENDFDEFEPDWDEFDFS